jgi:(1->4)-alpha-D-glucan 1-alpha-D-glucosylmutase
MTAYSERICAYMIKATREAKENSSWAAVNAEYEEMLTQFIRAILDAGESNPFLSDFRAFQQRILHAGLLNGLTQILCKLTAPGVPDIYQGDELWDFSLVDPDNRRPVDYSLRASMLTRVMGDSTKDGAHAFARSLVETLPDGRAKLYVIWKTLQLRKAQDALFTHGEYLPLVVTGAHAERVCAFARRHADVIAVVVAPRFHLRMSAESWGETAIELPDGLSPDASLQNVFNGEPAPLKTDTVRPAVLLATLLRDFPVALLTNRPVPADESPTIPLRIGNLS